METRTFRTFTLRTAIFASIGVTALATQGCDDGSGTGGAGGASSSSGSTSGKTSSSTSSASGTTTTGTTGSTSSTTTTATASSSTGGGMMNVERCFAGAAPPCPAADMAAATFGDCTANGEKVTAWISGPVEKAGECCYQVDVTDPNDPACGVVGRPLVVDRAPRKAAIVARANGWQGSRSLDPMLDGLEEAQRLALARAWADDAAFEHASVAAFSKTALELLAFGAPRELVEGCHRAALDEIDHASMGFALASAYAGAAVEPGAFPDAIRSTHATNLVELAVAAVHEGCVGETLAALVAAAQRDAATDPSVKAALVQIAADEARHAELSFRIVAWAIRAGGDDVTLAVRGAFEAAIATERAAIAAARTDAREGDDVLSAHGRLGELETAREKARGIEEVVLPSMHALVG